MSEDNSLTSYLKWRGDIALTTAPFNEADALVLAMLSYVDFSGIVPDDGQTMTLLDAGKAYFNGPNADRDHFTFKNYLQVLMESDRFNQAQLSYYVNILNQETQFCALKITLDNGLNYLSFRGTDDSIVGWKEDFEISFKVTAAQQQALAFVSKIMELDDQPYYLGGHSKGGNLAEYAAINVDDEKRKRIQSIFTFDSPGIASELDKPVPSNYLKEHLKRYVPEFSVIGRLFEPQAPSAQIVIANRSGLSQHDAFSWQIEGSHLVKIKHRNPQARIYNELINQWIGDATLEERESLTNDLFSALAAGGAEKITELDKNGFGGFGAILFSFANSSRRTRFVFGSLFSSIWNTLKNLELSRALLSPGSRMAWVLILLGIVCLTYPQYAIRIFASIAAIAALVFCFNRILSTANAKLKPQQKRFFISTYMLIFGLAIALISNNYLLFILAHYFLGVVLLIYAYIKLRQTILSKTSTIGMRLLLGIETIAAFGIGIVIIINPNYFTLKSIVILGILLVVYGFFRLAEELFRYRKRHLKNK